MKKLSGLIFLIVVGCSPSGELEKKGTKEADVFLNTKDVLEVTDDTHMPMCEIEQLNSCDVESQNDLETIYHCAQCGSVLSACDNCEGHNCEKCTKESCRCRALNSKKMTN